MNKRRLIARMPCAVAVIALVGVSMAGLSNSHAAADRQQAVAAAYALTKTSITFMGVQREYHEYAPTNVAALREHDARGVKVVISLHDNQQASEVNAQRTGWPALAEQHGFIALFPAAANGTWNTTHDANRTDDIEFVRTVAAAARAKYGLPSTIATYLTGVGAGATMAQEIAMRSPSTATGVAAIDGVAEAATLALPQGALPPSAMAVWQLRPLPTPLSVREQAQLDYWRKANAATGAHVRSAGAGRVQTLIYAAPDNPVQSVRMSTLNASPGDTLAISKMVWDDMFSRVVRFPDHTKTNGTLHADQTIASMGLIETVKELQPGTPRRWLTYVPPQYASLVAAGKKLPLIFSFHGRNGSARFQALISQWHSVAADAGFIVVYPHGLGATWTTSIAADNRDVQFFLDMFADLKATYQIDTERVFLNGSSQGTALTNRIAVQYPELFASIAPCYSGHLSAASYANPIVKTGVPLPVWQCRGVEELPSEFPGGTAGETAARNFWRETVNKNFGPPTVQIDGRRTTEVWSDGVAEYRWQLTADLGHFWHPGQARKMWDEMLSKYRRTADGGLFRVD